MCELIGLELSDSFGEDLLIGLVAHVGDEATLLGTEDVARTTLVEVLQGNAYAAPQIAEALDSTQTALGVFAEALERRCEEVAEGLAVATSYTATELMQFAQAVVVCVVDHDGIGVRHVDTILDDLRRHEDVVLVVAEVDEDLLHLLRCQLPVGDGDACVGDLALDEGGEVLNVADAAIDEVHLPVATHLEAHGLADDLRGGLREERLYGTAVGRRGVEVREVTRTHQ